MTGFIIKLRALFRLPRIVRVLLLCGRGAALIAYTRLIQAAKPRWSPLPLPLLSTIALGAV